MEIVHNSFPENKTKSPFSITYGEKNPSSTLKSIEKNLLDQMGSVFSVIHGGSVRRRGSHISA
ncbi:MAG: hypothetical protein EYC69_14035 [Bacteroidetes bacterium]|nr:MAG: hypothetical protein EYC69_14035 [Bacteroidota bacterium]